MGRALDNMKTGLRSFRKFVPADLVRDLIALGQEAALGGENREITTMFSDIADFTTLSERHNPGDLVVRLGEYFSLMGTVIHQQHGTVDKYIGDSVMAFWGAPMLLEDHAFRACRAALYCREVLSHLAHEWQSSPIPMFHTRFGIHSGKAIVGNMGSTERLNYTALGDSINLASRLEGLNKQYGTAILISEATYEQVKERMEVRLLDQVAVKGRSEPVHIYELLGEKGCLDTAAAEQVRRYEDAYRKYLERDFAGALQGFRAVLEQNGDDGPSQVFVKRCELYMQTPPGAEWSGVFKATSK
jgi:adenylate cyclase